MKAQNERATATDFACVEALAEYHAMNAERMAGDPGAAVQAAMWRRILYSLRSPIERPFPPRFTEAHAVGLRAVVAKLKRANGPVVLSWEEADAILDFAEAALAREKPSRGDIVTGQGERATAGDVEALQDAVSRGKVLFGTATIQHDAALRILNSLRFPVEQQPRAYVLTDEDGTDVAVRLYRDDAEATAARQSLRLVVTPLYAVQQPSNEEQQPIRCNCVQCSHHDADISWLG